MEDLLIQSQLTRWLMRTHSSDSIRKIPNIPVAIGTDIGIVRTENQDRAVVLRAQTTAEKFFMLAVLCDGMGGMQAGSNCAAIATSSFLTSCIRNRKLTSRERLLKAIIDANESVYSNYYGEGGATLSAFIIDDTGEKLAVNVGDSRIYISQDGLMEQISVDDTIAGQLERKEKVSSLDTKLLQFVGIGPDIEPHIIDLPNSMQLSRVLLTSDGAHSLNFDSFNSIINQNAEADVLIKRLLLTSRWCGGHDNATAVLFKDIDKINGDTNSFQSGSISLWDAYGELQLIGIDRQQQPGKKRSEQKETDSPSCNENSEKNELASSSEPTKQNKKRITRPNKERKKKPQLRIDFDDD